MGSRVSVYIPQSVTVKGAGSAISTWRPTSRSVSYDKPVDTTVMELAPSQIELEIEFSRRGGREVSAPVGPR